MVKTNLNYAVNASERSNHSFSIYLMNHFAETQALINRLCAYLTYTKPKILQIPVLDYFLTSTLMNTIFQFSEYMKQL